MKKLLTILFVTLCFCARSQSSSIDSLRNSIKIIQAQIADLQKYDTVVFTKAQMTLIQNTPTKQTVSINNYAAINNVVAQLTAALTRITGLEASLKALQTKVTGLKATTTIQ